MGRVFGYARVSTATQADDGEGLAAQREKLAGYAAMQGWRLDAVYADRGVSGSRPLSERPEGRAMLATLAPGDIVVVAKLDRAFRSANDALAQLDHLKGRGIALHLLDLGGDVTGGGVAGLTFTIMSAVAQFERERLTERIREGKAQVADQGRYNGGAPPFGYTVDAQGWLVRDPATAPGRDYLEAAARDGQSARAIWQALRQQGHTVSLPTVAKIAKACRAVA